MLDLHAVCLVLGAVLIVRVPAAHVICLTHQERKSSSSSATARPMLWVDLPSSSGLERDVHSTVLWEGIFFLAYRKSIDDIYCLRNNAERIEEVGEKKGLSLQTVHHGRFQGWQIGAMLSCRGN
jgi:hypothetical protein